jgi:hypothetical protein
MRKPVEYLCACPQNGRLRDGMGAILGYARVSTGDQDVAGQTMRLTQAGAIKVFSDVRSGRTMERPSLDALLLCPRGRYPRGRSSRPPRTLTRGVAHHRGRAQEAWHRSAQPGGKDRHQLGCRRGGLSRVRSDRAFRAAPDRRADKGRDRRRAGPRQACGSPTTRSGEDGCCARVGEGRPVSNRGRPAARLGALYRLS